MIPLHRASNYSHREKVIIVNIALKYLSIIENKVTNSHVNGQKAAAWENISDEYNALNPDNPRTAKQLKMFYDNTKRSVKKKRAEEQSDQTKTSGAPSTSTKLFSYEEKLLEALHGRCLPMPIEIDSPASYFVDAVEDPEEDQKEEIELNPGPDIERVICKMEVSPSYSSAVDVPTEVPAAPSPSPEDPEVCRNISEGSGKSRKTIAALYEEIASVTQAKRKRLESKREFVQEQAEEKVARRKLQMQLLEIKCKESQAVFELEKEERKLKCKLLQMDTALKRIEIETKKWEFKERFGFDLI